MKKKTVRAVAICVCAALALGLGAAAASRLIWGRSLQATVYEQILRRRYARHRTPEEEIARLEARLAEGEKPYALPEGLSYHVSVSEADFDGMQVFTLNAGDAPLVIYLHGGAYINSFNAYQWRFMDRLARQTGCEIVAPAYHLAPFGDYARAYADLTGLYRRLRADNPGRRLLLMGDSAGGGLALGLAEYWAGLGEALPERLILFSPWVDITMENPDIADYVAVEPILHLDLVEVHGRCWAGDGDPHDWMASPLFGDMAGLPPVTIFCGTREFLYPDIALAADRLADAGVDVDFRVARGMNHDYPLMPLPEARRAFRAVSALVAQPQTPGRR